MSDKCKRHDEADCEYELCVLRARLAAYEQAVPTDEETMKALKVADQERRWYESR